APIVPRVVEAVFRRYGQIRAIRIGRETIRTTDEHPFWVAGKGWLPARELVAGDHLLSHDDQMVVVAEVADTGEWEVVYNLRVAEYHTYFVGCDEWGFSVWAHNAECAVVTIEGANYVVRHQGKELFKGDAAGLRAYWQANPGYSLTTAEG